MKLTATKRVVNGKVHYTYDCDAIKELLRVTINEGYEVVEIEEGALGYGLTVLLPPDNRHYYFIIKEIYLNAWSSTHTIRKQRKLGYDLEKKVNALI